MSFSGYNATPPADDGTEVAANQITWATIKTKLADAILNALLSVRTNVSASTTLLLTDNYSVIPVDTASVVISLGDAATMGQGFRCWIKNNSGGNITVDCDTGGEQIDGNNSVTIASGGSSGFCVNNAINGYIQF